MNNATATSLDACHKQRTAVFNLDDTDGCVLQLKLCDEFLAQGKTVRRTTAALACLIVKTEAVGMKFAVADARFVSERLVGAKRCTLEIGLILYHDVK